MTETPKEEWHLDKRVPISIIIALAIQTVTFIYLATTWKVAIDYRIGTLEKMDAYHSSADSRLETVRAGQETRITILEQKFDFIQQSLRRIESATVPPSPR